MVMKGGTPRLERLTWSFRGRGANVNPTDLHHREDLEEPGEEIGREETEKTHETSERSEVGVREEL